MTRPNRTFFARILIYLTLFVLLASQTSCDVLSTSLFVMGIDKAKKLWNERKDFDFIAVTDSGEIYITRGIEKDFELSQDYNELNVSVIKSEQNQ